MNSETSNHHILPIRVYLAVATALLAFTIITVAVAQIDFGAYNLLIAMLIAGFKASLVVLFFMHLKYDNRMYMVAFIGSILFLAVFIIFTMFDTLRRGDIYDEVNAPIQEDAIIYQQPATTGKTHSTSDTTNTATEENNSGH